MQASNETDHSVARLVEKTYIGLQLLVKLRALDRTDLGSLFS